MAGPPTSSWLRRFCFEGFCRIHTGGAEGLIPIAWPYKVHIVLGMTIFLLFPFSRLVHVWSGFATLTYLTRAWQLVRPR